MVWEGQVPQNTPHAQVLGHAYLMNYLRIGCYLDDTWMLLGWYFSTCQFSQSNIHLRIPFSRDIAQSLTAARNRWKMDHGNMVFFFASFLSNVHNSYAIPWYWLLYRDPDAGLLFPIYSLAFIVYQVTIIFFGKTLIKILKLVPFWLFSPSSRFSRMHTAKPSELTFK